MKKCPMQSCNCEVPSYFLPEMKCSMCLTFGPPEVRLAPPERIVREKEKGRAS
jgi:hypothetical protein